MQITDTQKNGSDASVFVFGELFLVYMLGNVVYATVPFDCL